MTGIDWLQSLRCSLCTSQRIRPSVRRRKRRQAVWQTDVLEDKIPLGDTLGVGALVTGGVLAAPALSGLGNDLAATQIASPGLDQPLRLGRAPTEDGGEDAAGRPYRASKNASATQTESVPDAPSVRDTIGSHVLPNIQKKAADKMGQALREPGTGRPGRCPGNALNSGDRSEQLVHKAVPKISK